MIKVQSSDEVDFEMARPQANMCVTIKNMLEDLDGEVDAPIPLPNITGKILKMVIDYCNYHIAHPIAVPEDKKDEKRTDDIIPWDENFCKVDQATLFELILAANYLDVKPLLDLGCKTVANMIKGKTPEEIRKTFGIKSSLDHFLANFADDFTPEEEEQVRKENEVYHIKL